jgi:hypothetical protein
MHSTVPTTYRRPLHQVLALLAQAGANPATLAQAAAAVHCAQPRTAYAVLAAYCQQYGSVWAGNTTTNARTAAAVQAAAIALHPQLVALACAAGYPHRLPSPVPSQARQAVGPQYAASHSLYQLGTALAAAARWCYHAQHSRPSGPPTPCRIAKRNGWAVVARYYAM